MANIYATFNAADKSASLSLSNGDLTATKTGNDQWAIARSTISKTSGKWYWEYYIANVSGGTKEFTVGIASSGQPLDNFALGVGGSGTAGSHGWGFSNLGNWVHLNSTDTTPNSYTNTDVIGVALDMDAGTIEWFKNGVSEGATPYTDVSGTIFAAVGIYASTGQNTASITANFGATALTYTPPTGFNAGLYDSTADAIPSRLMMMGMGR